MDLYTDYAEEFSNTRSKSWDGWKKITDILSKIQSPNVLDLGCGNARFLDFLVDNKINYKSYTGIDYSKKLLEIAIAKYKIGSIISFYEKDLLEEWSLNKDFPEKFQIIVSFGFTHHLETKQSREYFFSKVKSLLSQNGVIIVSFWRFKENEKIFRKATQISEELYTIPFGNNAFRTCYNFTEIEIVEYFQKNNFKIVKHYFADAKSGRGNEYFVLTHA